MSCLFSDICLGDQFFHVLSFPGPEWIVITKSRNVIQIEYKNGIQHSYTEGQWNASVAPNIVLFLSNEKERTYLKELISS